MKIIDSIREQKGFRALGKADINDIKTAEEALGLKFADDYKEIIAEFGIVTFAGHEICGLCSSKRLNVVDVTTSLKSSNKNIDKNMYVIEKLNIDSVVIWQSTDGTVYQTEENSKPIKICKSLAEYFEK